MNFVRSSFVLILLIVIGTAYAQTVYNFPTLYAEKTTVTETTGFKATTYEEIHVVENGNKTARYITETRDISMANIVEETKSVSIWDGEWATTYNPETREGNKMKLDLVGNISGMNEDEQQQMADQLGQSTITVTEDIGTKEINGATCIGTRSTTNLMGMNTVTEIWMHEGFVMESNSESAGTTVNEKVTKFNKGATIDPEKLKVPSDVTITEMSSPLGN